MLAAFGLWDWLVVAGYFVVVTWVGLWVGRKRGKPNESGTEAYFLGGRTIPTWTAVVSIVASSLSAATFVGVPDSAFAGDWSYLILSVGGMVSVFVVALLFVPKLYAAGTVTIYGFLAIRFGEGARLAVSLAFIFGRMLASGSRLFLAAIPLSLLIWGAEAASTVQLVTAIVLIGGVVTFYTVFGGVKAVVWLDVLQLAIVVGAALLTVGMLVYRIPLGLGEIVDALLATPHGTDGGHKLRVVSYSTDPTVAYTLWTALLGQAVLSVAALGVDHDLAQRFLVTRSAFRGGLSVILSQVLAIVVISLFLVIGSLLFIFYRRPDIMGAEFVLPADGKSIYPWFLLTELPPVLSGLCIAGFFAIAQGSMDSAVNALAASVVSDVIHPIRRRLGLRVDEGSDRESRWVVAAVGAVMFGFAIFCAITYDPKSRTLLDFALGVMTFAFTGMLGVFLTALLTRRGNSASVVAALVAGALTVVLLQDTVLGWWSQTLVGVKWKLAWPWWMTVGTVVAFLVCFAGSPVRGQQSLPETST
jgi:SSS family transporter